jgi:hypothetical protein
MRLFSLRARATLAAGLLTCALVGPAVRKAEPQTGAKAPELDALAAEYGKEIRPLTQRYCQRCHGDKLSEADINLERLATWADVRKQPRVFQKMAEMLDTNQMPPKDARQPTVAERLQLQKWVRSYLTAEAKARAGDPGPVVLRRLSNAEYTYTLRDLTGVESLQPAREFPVDGAAGEGFTNTGNALVMSPALLTKYLDAAKEVARHAVLLPDGFRFSSSATRRDLTDESLARIREFYREFTDPRGGDKVNLQGVVFDTNQGGRLPLERYLQATLAEREALQDSRKTIENVAKERGLNAKYLGTLWKSLTSTEASLLMDPLRRRWRAAQAGDAAALAAEIAAWQAALWRFGTVGHIGKVGGPKAWLEPVNPLVTKQDIRFKIPTAAEGAEITLSLVAGDSGDGNASDFVVWQQPRLVAPGRPDLLLRDVRDVTRTLAARREQLFVDTAKYLSAATDAAMAQGKADSAELARKHGVDADGLRAWLDYLGIGTTGPFKIEGHFTNKLTSAAGYDFIKGWGSHDTPLLLANSSGQHVRIPGNMKPHGVAVHPSPTLQAAVGWRSPLAGPMRVEGKVTHAHPECGNGVTWSLELRRGGSRRRLAAGTAQGSKEAQIGPLDGIDIQVGDLVSLLIGPRDRNHACDLTAIDLKLTSRAADARTWNLAEEVSGDVLAANPRRDRFGNTDVWHFYTEADAGPGALAPVIPPGSLLAKWQAARSDVERNQLAENVQKLLSSGPPEKKDSPDAALYRQLASFGGPLLRPSASGPIRASPNGAQSSPTTPWGPDPALFGKHPDGKSRDPASLCVQAPSVIEIRLPADLVAGCELVTSAALDPETAAEGSAQLQVIAAPAGLNPAARQAGLLPSKTTVTMTNGPWTSDNRQTTFAAPIVVREDSTARRRIEAAFDEFRRLFPAALCYTKIVPVDEVVTLTLFYREDDHLVRLMLDEKQAAQLQRLWDELHYISHDALTLVDAYKQLMEYATQDADPKVFEPLRKPINDRAQAFRKLLLDSEPRHLDALLDFAARAYRRPLAEAEAAELRALYRRLREQEIAHDEAFRLTLARVLVAPAFLYRIEKPSDGTAQTPVSDWELATRLSYFLWSSVPDAELRQALTSGGVNPRRLSDTDTLLAQTRRMLRDAKTRRLATEFACQWLHIHDFENLNEKSERHFPTFVGLRGAMHEESILFFTDLFQNDRSILNILDADYTFLNESLAKHYGIPGVTGPEWRRVDGVRKFARGGILAQATTLTKQSGASRTSPILRGNWISEVLLGERLPRPPKDVPQLPEDETATQGLTVRQLVEKHSSDPKCAICHQRIDAFGFALEGFDAIGRKREKDLGDRLIDTRAKTMDGLEFDGLDGLRNYLLTQRRDAFVRQFCRKLLGYALGRGVQLSDEPLLEEMLTQLKASDYRVGVAMEIIVKSRQFREIRGRKAEYDE